MARRQRAKSGTGIYHVMLRGINKQDVFLDDNDFESMLRIIKDIQFRFNPNEDLEPIRECSIYAYCILHNHMHILIKEGEQSISEIMKRIQDRFVIIYNRKYDRVGHLFQDRFASEPVNDFPYFRQLIRYIHRNPIKAMEAHLPEDYPFSSWREYLYSENALIKGSDPLMRASVRLCDTGPVIRRFGYKELVQWVNEDVDDKCMDMDTFTMPMPEVEAWDRLKEISNAESVEQFRQFTANEQIKYITQLIAQGASLRQASRLSSLSYRVLWNALHPEEYQAEQRRKNEERKLKRAKMKEMASAMANQPPLLND